MPADRQPAEGMTGASEAIDLRAQRREKGLRLGEFGKLSGRREALDRRGEHGVGIGVAIGRAIKLRQRARRAIRSCALFATAR